MRVTLDFVRERFFHFNDLCFGGRLPAVNLRISSSARTFGTLRHPRVFKEKPKASDFVLSVSNRLDLEQSVIEDTIIHEMIHLYILFFGLEDSSAHGPLFRQIMGDINRLHGRNITISRRTTDSERTTDRLIRPRILLVTEFETGERTVTVCSPRCVKGFVKTLTNARNIRFWQLYITASPHLSHYPLSRTLKFYKIDAALLERELADAHRVEIKDGKFTISS